MNEMTLSKMIEMILIQQDNGNNFGNKGQSSFNNDDRYGFDNDNQNYFYNDNQILIF